MAWRVQYNAALLCYAGFIPPPAFSACLSWEFFQYGTQNPAAQYSLLPGRDDAIIAAMQAYNRASSEQQRQQQQRL